MSEKSETPANYWSRHPSIRSRKEIEELQRRIAAALDELDGYEDVEDRPNGEGVRPNLAMRVGMILRGEDRP